MVDRDLLWAASMFAAATAFGAVVSAQQDIPGEPLGLHVPGRVSVHVAVGLGSGLSAPWPMPVAALVAALEAGTGAAWTGRVCAVVGSMVLMGTAVEPVTWGRRSGSSLVRATVALNLLSGAALLVAGRRFGATA